MARFSSRGVIVGDITPDKWFFFSLPLANLIIIEPLLGKEDT
jgi:hypothetical protein